MTERGAHLPADGHAGDLVSARLDGELDAATAAWVDEHLDSCDDCRDIAGAVDVARAWMRSAPTVDSTPVVGGVIAHRQRMIGTGLVFVAIALFVLGILAVTSSVSHPRVVPSVDEFVAAHENEAHGSIDGVRRVDAAASHYATPAILGPDDAEMERTALYDGDDLTTVVYTDGSGDVTVYEQPGRVDWDALPPGSLLPVGSIRAWVRDGSPAVLVAEIGDLVVTLVGDDRERVEQMAQTLEAPRRTSTVDRVHDSCQQLMQIFALGG